MADSTNNGAMVVRMSSETEATVGVNKKRARVRATGDCSAS